MIKTNKVYHWYSYLEEVLKVHNAEICDIKGYMLEHEHLRTWLNENGFEYIKDYSVSEVEKVINTEELVIINCNGIAKFYTTNIKEEA